jgi:hypothetical protein
LSFRFKLAEAKMKETERIRKETGKLGKNGY